MSSEKQFSVYKHTFPNNKVYIGITSQNPQDRWKQYNNDQPKLYNAIKKYGWDNVQHEVLFTNLTQEEAAQQEIKLIEQYDAIKNGYNNTKGGEGRLRYTTAEEIDMHILEQKRKKQTYQYEHRDHIKQKHHQRYLLHKEEISKQNKVLYQDNKEKYQTKNHEQYLKHRKKRLQQQKDYDQSHIEEKRLYNRQRYYKLKEQHKEV